MTISPAQRASYANDHHTKIPFATAPRHLAGPGDPRHVTHALLAGGWSLTSAPGDPRTVLTGTDQAHQLVLDPFSNDSCWRLHSADWSWDASFDRMVPVEIIAGVTDRLVDGPRRGDIGPWERMAQAGWAVERRPDKTGEALSPGPYPVRAELRPISEEEPDRCVWRIEALPEYGGPRIWHIWISGPVPEHLLSGLVEQLVSPAPVLRRMFDLTHYGARQIPSPLSPEQAVEAHFDRVDATQQRARARRRTRLKTALPAPATPPAAPAPASPAPAAARR
ncbi:DUF317 domain-containing protein [Streptomyces sp. TRM76323]|uniref:DUF317 domain-containing protein n=1 Tax=Streptomyces tamarix TaxID=3078565 RepID=A0ABU3QQZ2_9ACTN|nr:DUF317 domain-containing protein [Streptomyces tamarix]MDT9685031.1 DUF317 domain-containing protein [Streptomyces tamarix]